MGLLSDGVTQFAIRSNDNTRRTWTLTSLAVRIAHALDLHREQPGGKYTFPYRPFEREMRRRLWCSDPIIAVGSFETQLPLNVNDEDLIPNDPHEVPPREEHTDITFALVCHEILNVERRLNHSPAGELDRSQSMLGDPWAQRKKWVIDCQRGVEHKYLRHCNANISAQRFTILIADIMFATLWVSNIPNQSFIKWLSVQGSFLKRQY